MRDRVSVQLGHWSGYNVLAQHIVIIADRGVVSEVLLEEQLSHGGLSGLAKRKGWGAISK
jgi:hypothetical protein